MRLLLTNDDGFDAAGLGALAAALRADHEVWVVAPSTERSAQSHSLTMHKPLRLHVRGERRYAVTGTPADCVYLGLHHVLVGAGQRPDLVVSGINFGSNLASDVHYSGTVAAAREAVIHGVPAVAISLERSDAPMCWDTAGDVARRVVARLAARPGPSGVVLNVNVPNVERAALRGIKPCRLGDRYYDKKVDARLDPRGHPYFWLGGAHSHFGDDADSDGPLLSAKWATITPITVETTAMDALATMRGPTGGWEDT